MAGRISTSNSASFSVALTVLDLRRRGGRAGDLARARRALTMPTNFVGRARWAARQHSLIRRVLVTCCGRARAGTLAVFALGGPRRPWPRGAGASRCRAATHQRARSATAAPTSALRRAVRDGALRARRPPWCSTACTSCVASAFELFAATNTKAALGACCTAGPSAARHACAMSARRAAAPPQHADDDARCCARRGGLDPTADVLQADEACSRFDAPMDLDLAIPARKYYRREPGVTLRALGARRSGETSTRGTCSDG